MIYQPPRPASTPTVANLQASLDRHFGPGTVSLTRHDGRHISVAAARDQEAVAKSYIAGWFEAKRRFGR